MKKISTLCSVLLVSSCVFSQVAESQSNNIDVPQGRGCCDPPKVIINIPAATSIGLNADNTVTLSQNIQVNTTPVKLITAIQAELNYFEFVPGSDDCLACNKNSVTFGNFIKGSVSSVPAVGSGTHIMTSNFSTPKSPGTFPASFTISLPPVVKCCEGLIRWCIRYVITFDDCTVCTKVVCYEKKKTATDSNSNLTTKTSKS